MAVYCISSSGGWENALLAEPFFQTSEGAVRPGDARLAPTEAAADLFFQRIKIIKNFFKIYGTGIAPDSDRN